MSTLNEEQTKKLLKLKENISILNANITTWKQDKTIFGGITKIAKGNISKAEVQLRKRQDELNKLKEKMKPGVQHFDIQAPDIQNSDIQSKEDKSSPSIKPSGIKGTQQKNTENKIQVIEEVNKDRLFIEADIAKHFIKEEKDSEHRLYDLSPGDDFIYSKNEDKDFLSIDFGDEKGSQDKTLYKKKSVYKNVQIKDDTNQSKNDLGKLKIIFEKELLRFKNQWKKTQKEFINFREDKRKLEEIVKKLKIQLEQQENKSKLEKLNMAREKAKLEAEYKHKKSTQQ